MKKKLIAILCMIVMLVNSIGYIGNTMTVSAKEGVYKELTFSDWGMTNGEYADDTTFPLNEGTATSMDGVAFNGMFEVSDSVAFYLASNEKWTGLCMHIRASEGLIDFNAGSFKDYIGGGQVLELEIQNALGNSNFTLKDNEFQLRVTFDMNTDDTLALGVYINGTFIKDIIYTGTGDTNAQLGTSIYIYLASGTMDLRDVVNGSARYTEKTLKDFEIYPGTLTSEKIGVDGSINTYDELAISGEVKFGSDGWLMLGHENKEITEWSGIQLSANQDGGLNISSTLFTDELKQFEIEPDGSAYTETSEGYLKADFSYIQAAGGWHAIPFPQVTYKKEIHIFMKNDSTERRMVQLNWTAAKQVLDEEGNDITSSVVVNGETWLPANSGWCEVIYPLPNNATGASEFNCYMPADDKTIGDLLFQGYYPDAGVPYVFTPDTEVISSEEAGVNFREDYAKLRFTFDYTSSGIDMGVYVNGTYVKKVSFGDSTDGTRNIKDLIGNCIMATIGLSTKGSYKELTFKDFNIPMGVMGTDTIGTKDGLTTLDGVAVSGKLKFGSSWLLMGHESRDIPDWTGIQLQTGSSDNGDLNVSVDLIAPEPLKQITMNGVAGGTYTTTEEGYIKVDFDGETQWCDVNFEPISANGEIHFFINNDSDYPRYLQHSWTMAVMVKDASGNDITNNTEGATKIPANSGWVEVIYGGTSFSQFNCVSRDTGEKSVDSLLIKGYYVDTRATNHYQFAPSAAAITKDETGVDFRTDMADMRFIFDYTDMGVDMGVFVNGNYIKTISFADSTDGAYNIKEILGHYMMATGGLVQLGEYKERQDVSYELTESTPSYLVTGDAKVMKDGVEITLPDTCDIKEPGDYEIITTVLDVGTEYHQNVALYKIGDVDLNGVAGETTDLTALEAIYVTTSFEAKSAAQKAADLDNDGRVDAEDWQLMKQICAASDSVTELQAVKEKYHPAAKSYDYLDKIADSNDVMPIIGYYGPYNNNGKDLLTDEIFELVKASKINLISYSYNSASGELSTVRRILEMAQEHQLGWFVYDPSLNEAKTETVLTDKEFADALGKYSYYDAFLGNLIADEPHYKDASTCDDPMENYTAISERLNKYGNIIGHMNLAPEDSGIVNKTTLGIFTTDYFDEYVAQYVDEAKPQILSMDDYPFNDVSSEGVINAEGYFRSLIKMREQSVAKDKPFWWYVQAGGNFKEKGTEEYSYNERLAATEEETYWNVNTALAFGAKGIQYFTLIQPQSFYDGDHTKQLNGLLDANGNKNVYYDYAVNINTHIENVDEVLMKAENIGVITTDGRAKNQVKAGHDKYQENTTEYKNPIISASDTKNLKSVTASDTTYGAIVGCFNYRNMEAYYVMNYNVTAGTSQTVTLAFNEGQEYNYRIIQQGQTAYSQIGTGCELTIPAGEAVLVVLDGVAGDANGDGLFDSKDLIHHKRMEVKEARVEFAQGYDPDLYVDDIINEIDTKWMRYYLALGKFGEE